MQAKDRIQSSAMPRWWTGLWRSPLPKLGCEISQTGISVARWSRSSSGLETAAWKPVPPGAIEASPLRENLHHADMVQRAVSDGLSAMGLSASASSRGGVEAVLVIPDQAARLFVLSFETFPDRVSEGLPLVKWRLKKSLPFDIDSAALSYYVQRSADELQVVAVAAPNWIVRQYEAVAEQCGLRPRWVTLSTLASLGLVESTGGAWRSSLSEGQAGGSAIGAGKSGLNQEPGILVAKYSPPWFTTALLQGGMLRLFRTMGLAAGDDGLLAPADVLGAVYPSVAYFQDNFHGQVARGYLSGLGGNTTAIAEALATELNLRTDPLVPDPGLLSPGSGGSGNGTERHFAALLGVLREQQSA